MPKLFGSISELEELVLRAADSDPVTLTTPAAPPGSSATFLTPNFGGGTDTLVSLTSTDTLTNKTLTSPVISTIVNTGTLTLPTSTDTLVGRDTTDTLTNKTIDGDINTIQDLALTSLKTVFADANKFITRDGAGIVVSTNTVPTGTVVGTTDTQTLTNKTIDSDLNTITNIVNADIKAAAAISLDKLAALTANRATETDASGFIIASAVTNTELGYLSGVTSAIQTQIDSKQADVITTRGDVVYGNASNVAARLPIGASGTVLTSDGTDVSWSTPAGTGDVTAAANISDNRIVRGDGGAKGIQESLVTLDDNGDIDGVATLSVDDGVFTALATSDDVTVPTSHSMIHSNMTVSTGNTFTVSSGAFLDVFDIITVDGTLTVNGTATVR